MNNNIDINIIRRNLVEVSNLFDPEKRTYQILNEVANNPDSTTEDLIKAFKEIGDLKEYPPELANYLHKTYNDLQALDELNKEIENLIEETKKENEILINEFKKRNVEYDGNLNFETDYENMTYNQKKEYIEKLKADLELLKEKNKKIDEEEKKLGEKFDEKTLEEVNGPDLKESTHNEEMVDINEKAEDNYKIYNNPTLDDVTTYYNFMADNQTDESKLNVEIEYKEDGNIEVKIGYKGTEVNEKNPMLLLNYTDKEYFDTEVLPYLIERHIVDTEELKKEQDESHIKSENSFGETMAVVGATAMITKIASDMDNQRAMYLDDLVRQNDKQRVRVREFDNTASASTGLYIIPILLIITIIVVILFLVLK